MVRQLVNSGIHFGHRVSRWNPKMDPYIFGRRNLIHIIDIRETVKGLLRAKKFISQVVGRGGDVLFVGTKRQARHAIEAESHRVGMPYVSKRWLGGTLTNFRTIRSRLGRLEELEAIEADGRLQQYSKKAVSMHNREMRKIRSNLEGIREMDQLPAALLVVDVRREHLAVREAKKLGIPTVCLIDTDSDPDFADIPIPGNDDSMRSIETIVTHLADAVEEGKRGRLAGGPVVEGEPAFPRRSKRRATARATEEAEKPVPAEAAAVEQSADAASGTDEQPSTRSEQPSAGSDDRPEEAGSGSEVPAMPETSP
ncbi:MAG: 30S ribosomal protein S2 [Planctomycetota bacterium]